MDDNASLKIGIYRHYNGNLYKVLGIANHSETLNPMVIYQALYDSKDFGSNALWVRPLEMFLENVNIAGKNRKRFEFVSNSSQQNSLGVI